MSLFRATVSKAARFAREPSSEVTRFALGLGQQEPEEGKDDRDDRVAEPALSGW